MVDLMHNKRLKRDCQRAAFPVQLSRGGFKFGVMRCQPLRRTLYASNQKVDSSDNLISESA
ncbi:hypothetical protein GWZ74_04210 [Vibrio cholerae]|nr:hypothetical protein [Vibrio cholerae]NOE95120.1 hypothetical protein [Vibrio cholerae]NOF01195.1 hypothetical protein [Vibrio cholerae]NOF12199.1 hypothetical protein [Vibrio cholerae]NOF16499.1 hypothetical protein [Vibrio cholerae]